MGYGGVPRVVQGCSNRVLRVFRGCSKVVDGVFRRCPEGALMMFQYLILVTGTTGACVKRSLGCKIFQIKCKKKNLFSDFWVFFLLQFLGVRYLGFKNPALVKDFTNMRCGCSVGI